MSRTTWDEQQALYDKSPLSHLNPASEAWRRTEFHPYGRRACLGLNDLRDKVHNLAIEKGWHEDRDIGNPHVLGSMLALIHSEVSEALEEIRSPHPGRIVDNGKPEGFAFEVADIIIRTLDLCGALGIDIEEAVRVKHSYNCTRSHRHGGKKL